MAGIIAIGIIVIALAIAAFIIIVGGIALGSCVAAAHADDEQKKFIDALNAHAIALGYDPANMTIEETGIVVDDYNAQLKAEQEADHIGRVGMALKDLDIKHGETRR